MSVIVKLFGGLGNQMFQYAAGRALAHRLEAPLKLDISSYANDGLREYALDQFNIEATIAARNEIEKFKPPRAFTLRSIDERVRRRILPWHRQRVLQERFFSYDPDIQRVQYRCYLQGYWQSEKYFADCTEILRKEFSLKQDPDEANRELLNRIGESEAVSLHIRRGDYVTDPATNRLHGVLGLDYYQQAMAIVSSYLDHPLFFVFSDDLPWVKEHLKSNFPLVFVEHNLNKGRDADDLRLMKHCRHHIIANSSFSWWGAWLGEAGDRRVEVGYKRVIAPKRWFSKMKVAEKIEGKALEKDTRDLIPDRWIKI